MQRDINTNTRQARQRSPLSLWGAAILCFVVVLMVLTPRIPQPKSYHDFADKRKFFGVCNNVKTVFVVGIPYTLDVTSNFPFLAIGLAGLALCYYGNYVKMR
nr:putative ceramidase [Ipomoea batatas]